MNLRELQLRLRSRFGLGPKRKAAQVNIRKLELRPAGMFSNVNEVVQQLYLAERSGYRFFIDWSQSCYADPNRPGDPWEYYFERCFLDVLDRPAGAPVLLGGAPVACAKDNIITPRRKNGDCNPLLLPSNRLLPHRLIAQHIRLRADVVEIIDAFARQHFQEPVIGLHIRGAGRLDGGVAERNQTLDLIGGVPLPAYFRAVEQALERRPDARIFACSDSSFVIDSIVERFGERVFIYDATRSPFGELHAGHPRNAGLQFDRYRLGLDVLVEAYLLSRTDFLVHGNSNVVNFILCQNPELATHYIYDY